MSKRKGSNVWNFFKVNPVDVKKASCSICGENVARGGKTTRTFNTANLLRHLQGKHAKEFSELLNKKTKATSDSVDERTQLSNQQSLDELFTAKQLLGHDSKKALNITKLLGEMIAVDIQPFSVVEDVGFRRLISFLEPRYVIPSEKQFREKILNDMYTKVRSKVAAMLEESMFISSSIDIWSSQSLDSYLAVTVHWIDEKFQRKFACIGVSEFSGTHNAEQISNKLNSIYKEWNINKKIYVIVRDNAANMVAALDKTDYLHYGCIVHTLQLVVKDGLLSQRSVIDSVAAARRIITHFKHSPLSMSSLHELQEQLQVPVHCLIQDEPTRWDSTFDMVSRLLEQRKPVSAALADKRSDLLLSNNQWTLLEEMSKVLKIFKELTLVFSSRGSSVSMIIPMVNMLKQHLKPLDRERGVGTMRLELMKALESRLGSCENNSILSIATLLDPRYKANGFDSKAAAKDAENLLSLYISDLIKSTSPEVKDKSCTQISSSIPDIPNENAVFGMLQTFLNRVQEGFTGVSEELTNSQAAATKILQQYLLEPLSPTDANPLHFWEMYPNKHLRKAARKYLSAPPGSVESERIFSTAGLISRGCRNRLSPSKVESLLFLSKALPLINFEY